MSPYNSYHSPSRSSSFRGSRKSYSVYSSSKRRSGTYIDPSKFIKAAQPSKEEDYVAQNSFTDFEIAPLLKENLKTKGYSVPTPIQDQTIPLALAGKDVIGIANTGTGKTAAFALPLLNKLINNPGSRALIVAPTRELAMQIEDECRWMAKGSGLFGSLLIGGAPIVPQLRDLKSNPQIVIGTPGRIKDHIERRTLVLSGFNIVVLDEVDRMLDMGFINDVRSILQQLAESKQSLFFSATLDPRVKSLIESFAKDPVTLSLKSSEASENVNQDVVKFSSTEDKINKLHDILISNQVEKSIIFGDTQRAVERLSQQLIDKGFSADAIHGGKSQGQRQRALRRFKNNEIKILVATDVAARGIDVVDITHVINYSTPQSYDDYVHRIGRAGRAGRVGHALTFVNH